MESLRQHHPVQRGTLVFADTILGRLHAEAGTGSRFGDRVRIPRGPSHPSVGRKTAGKYSGKCRGPRVQASRQCGLGSLKGWL